jgi:quinol monooxygenase YgiN
MTDENIIVFATLIPKAGKEAELETFLRGMCAPSRAEKGCVTYNLFKRAEGGSSFHFFEVWSSAAALDSHRLTPHYKNFRARLGDLVEGPPSPIMLKRVDSLL